MQRKLVVLMFVFAFLFSVSSVTSAEVIKLKLANYFPTTHMNSAMLGKFCEELNKKLAGKVEITQYTGGTLLSAPKMAAGVETGIADIGFSHCSYTRGRFPVMEIMEAAPRVPEPLDSRPCVERFLQQVQAEGVERLSPHHLLYESGERAPDAQQAREDPGRP